MLNPAFYLRALASLLNPFRSDMLRTLTYINRADSRQVEAAIPKIWETIQEARKHAAHIGNQMLEDAAEEYGYDAYIPPMGEYTYQAVKTLFREYSNASDSTLVDAMERHVRMAARRQVIRAVPNPELDNYIPISDQVSADTYPILLEGFDELDKLIEETENALEDKDREEGYTPSPKAYPIGWARVLTGAENCGFCVMLASRGPVYTSKLAATYRGGRKQVAAGKRGRRGSAATSRARRDKYRLENMDKFHDSCDCLVVPVFKSDNWVGKKDYERLSKFYESTLEDVDKNPEKYAGKSPVSWLEQAMKETPLDTLVSNKGDEAAHLNLVDTTDERHVDAVYDDLIRVSKQAQTRAKRRKN